MNNQKVVRTDGVIWTYFRSEKYQKWHDEQQKEESKSSDDFNITGKYLFFNPNFEILTEVAEDEIANNGFDLAKINSPPLDRLATDYVLCLYYEDDSRKNELADKYPEKNGMRYRYWKSDEDTQKGKYSKEYLKTMRRR